MAQHLLVTGASGQLGRRVIELLLEAGEAHIIATTRNPEKLSELSAKGVDVRYASFDEPDSLAQAFQGADRLLLISTDVLGVPGKRLQQHQNAVQAAASAGVKHVIYTSLVAADNTPVLFAPDHAGTEKTLAASKLGWTILRNNLYMDLLIGSVNQALKSGGWYSASGNGKTAYITREDCAQAAATALASDFEGKRTLDITGSEALSQAEIVTLANAVTGQSIQYVPIPLEAMIQGMVDAGLPRPLAETYASIQTATAEGKFAKVSSAFTDLTGRQPQTIRDFLTAQKDTFALA
jgi:NAD(P)H dehydrogenase (quinone)